MRPPTPADSGGSSLGSPVASGAAVPAAAGFLAAPVAEALAIRPEHAGHPSEATISGGGCFVRQLPVDPTCGAAARRFFREALSSLAMPSGLIHDGITMASELAANTLHAHRSQAQGPSRGTAGVPEIWVYLRGTGRTRELVCKVFDTERAWSAGLERGMSRAPLDSVSGRGLQVVAGLSAGQWGCHLTRSRLGSWRVPGKVVWFVLRIPPATLPDHIGRPRYSSDWLIDELEAMLAERGLSASIVRADTDGMTVLSISRHLTVWRHGNTVSWRAPSGRYQQADLADLVEVAEQIVCAHEDAAISAAEAV
jgi:hypothetical protein